jgi:hypothetical protein
VDGLARESDLLHGPCSHDDVLHFATGERWFFLADLTDLHSWHLDEEIDSIKDRSGETRSVAVDRHRCTDTCLLRITHISTGTWIHSADERESCGIPTGLIDSVDCDLAIFEWLSQGLED